MNFLRPELKAWALRWAEPLSYGFAALILAGLLWRSGALGNWPGWIALGAVMLLCFWLGRAGYLEARLAAHDLAPGVVMIDERQIAYLTPNDPREGGIVSLESLTAVDIHTNALGPFAEDLFWILEDESGKILRIPQGAAGSDALLPSLEALPGLNHAAILDAMGSTKDAVFTIWRRPGPGGAAARITGLHPQPGKPKRFRPYR
ncbi:MAG: hypothetical protein MRY63_04525 [Neomegalonema sp.]|nr:hypothetical protein [Neomegalonema sp.]